jgi:uncharacterized protein YggE
MRVDLFVPILAVYALQTSPAPLTTPTPALPPTIDAIARRPGVAVPAQSLAAGITVTGRSSRVLQADTTVFSANVQVPPEMDVVATGNAIVAALKKDGIADAAWSGNSLQLRYPSMIVVTGSAKPAQLTEFSSMFVDASKVAGAAVAQNLQLGLQLRDCAAALEALRHAALTDARRQAEVIARDLGVHVGSPVNVSAITSNVNLCPAEKGATPGAFGFQAPWNPAGTIAASQSVTVTFAIAK